MASSSPVSPSLESLIFLLPSKGMNYGASSTLTNQKTDGVILAILKEALTSQTAGLKSEIDTVLATMFNDASAPPALLILNRDNDSLEFLTGLQARTTWAKGMDGTAFCFMFQSLVKARQNWVKEVDNSFTFFRNDYSKTSVEITNFLEAIGDNKWGGVDAEVELLKLTDG
ncbi:hypothetical protein PG999_004820 [Apiospora kogelbergensis]|uniref:Uncharacterized protein n=1 Tax=Apiospora kogelbergensis TaxID=1337665 RepID=A0AAW0R0A4_9PEZI